MTQLKIDSIYRFLAKSSSRVKSKKFVPSKSSLIVSLHLEMVRRVFC